MEFERQGVPTATICTDQFIALANTIAGARGLKGLPLVVIPHPLSGLGPDKVQAKAESSIDLVIRALTG